MQVDTIAQSHYFSHHRISDCTITYNGSHFVRFQCVCSACYSGTFDHFFKKKEVILDVIRLEIYKT